MSKRKPQPLGGVSDWGEVRLAWRGLQGKSQIPSWLFLIKDICNDK